MQGKVEGAFYTGRQVLCLLDCQSRSWYEDRFGWNPNGYPVVDDQMMQWLEPRLLAVRALILDEKSKLSLVKKLTEYQAASDQYHEAVEPATCQMVVDVILYTTKLRQLPIASAEEITLADKGIKEAASWLVMRIDHSALTLSDEEKYVRSEAEYVADCIGDIRYWMQIAHIMHGNFPMPAECQLDLAFARKHYATAARMAQAIGDDEALRAARFADVWKTKETEGNLEAAKLALEFGLTDVAHDFACEALRECEELMTRGGLASKDWRLARKQLAGIMDAFPEFRVKIKVFRPIRRLKWRVLPPKWWLDPEGATSEVASSRDDQEIAAALDRVKKTEFRADRCQLLEDYHPQWYTTVKWFGQNYYVVAVIEGVGAFAECPLVSNALYFLGESKNWQEVFSRSKDMARKMGAIRLPHNKGWKQTVVNLIEENRKTK
ncbi:MAG: hypothetical protein WCW17_04060 [Patescibacteria group bacterium]|jgi:hypothetical protein